MHHQTSEVVSEKVPWRDQPNSACCRPVHGQRLQGNPFAGFKKRVQTRFIINSEPA